MRWGKVRWIVVLRHFSILFGYIWRSVSTAGWTNCFLEWTSNLPLATDNYLSWESNPSREGRVVSKLDTLTTRPRRPLINTNLGPYSPTCSQTQYKNFLQILSQKTVQKTKAYSPKFGVTGLLQIRGFFLGLSDWDWDKFVEYRQTKGITGLRFTTNCLFNVHIDGMGKVYLLRYKSRLKVITLNNILLNIKNYIIKSIYNM